LLLEQLRVVGQLADRVDVLRHELQCAAGSLRSHRDHSQELGRYAANWGECVRVGMRQSMPSSSIDSCAADRATRPSMA